MPILIAALSIVGTAVVGTLGAFIGSTLESRREHRQWLRNARLTAYSTLITAIDELETAVSHSRASGTGTPPLSLLAAPKGLYARVALSSSDVQMLGPKRVREAASELQRVVFVDLGSIHLDPGSMRPIYEALETFGAAARAALNTD